VQRTIDAYLATTPRRGEEHGGLNCEDEMKRLLHTRFIKWAGLAAVLLVVAGFVASGPRTARVQTADSTMGILGITSVAAPLLW
jgi:hypothetical protein